MCCGGESVPKKEKVQGKSWEWKREGIRRAPTKNAPKPRKRMAPGGGEADSETALPLPKGLPSGRTAKVEQQIAIWVQGEKAIAWGRGKKEGEEVEIPNGS